MRGAEPQKNLIFRLIFAQFLDKNPLKSQKKTLSNPLRNETSKNNEQKEQQEAILSHKSRQERFLPPHDAPKPDLAGRTESANCEIANELQKSML